MKARILIESASLGPDDMKTAFQAFDGAWALIAARYTSPNAIEAARLHAPLGVLREQRASRSPRRRPFFFQSVRAESLRAFFFGCIRFVVFGLTQSFLRFDTDTL
jgi:hypothetical protein